MLIESDHEDFPFYMNENVNFLFLFFLSSMPILIDDELFSDSYKMRLVDGVVYEVFGKYITIKEGAIELAGSNPSAEEASEDLDENSTSGVDIVLHNRLQETFIFGDKKTYLAYLKKYMKL